MDTDRPRHRGRKGIPHGYTGDSNPSVYPFAHYDSEENKKEYELQQKQREMERRIRETKSHLMGYKKALENSPTEETRKVTEEKYQKKAALLKKQNEAYAAFCKENNLKPLNERLAVAKWDRKQAAQAREAAKKAQKSVENSTESGTINKKATVRKITDRGEVANPMPEEEY